MSTLGIVLLVIGGIFLLGIIAVVTVVRRVVAVLKVGSLKVAAEELHRLQAANPTAEREALIKRVDETFRQAEEAIKRGRFSQAHRIADPVWKELVALVKEQVRAEQEVREKDVQPVEPTVNLQKEEPKALPAPDTGENKPTVEGN